MLGSLRIVLIAAVLAANLLLGGLLAYTLSAARDQRETEVRTNVENVATLLDSSITESIEKIDLFLRATVESLEQESRRSGRLNDPDIKALLGDRRIWLPKLKASLRVTDAAGLVRYCSDCVAAYDRIFADPDFLAAHSSQTGSGLSVTDLLSDPATSDQRILLTRRFSDPEGGFAGTVSVGIPAASFTQILAQIAIGPHDAVVLRDANTAVIARFPPASNPSWQAGRKNYSNEFNKIVTSNDTVRAFYTAKSPDGVERSFAYHRLSVAPFHLVAGMGTDDYRAEWRGLVEKSAVVAVLFLAGSIALAIFLWRTALANARSRQWMHNASDGIHILDLDHNVLDVSEAFCHMLGYTRGELIGMNASIWDARFPNGTPSHFTAKPGEPSDVLTFELPLRRKDGSCLDVEMTVRQLDFAGRKVFFCSARDITERKQAERALVESEARFRKFFEENGSVMLQVDPASGEICGANRAASAYYGYASEQLLGMSVDQINIMPAGEVALERRRALSKERGVFNFRHRLASGEERDVEVYSAPIEIDGKSTLFSIVHDVSQRNSAEAQNRRLSNLYAALSQCNQAIVHCTSESELFSKICHCVVEYGLVATVWIGFVNETTETIEPVAWCNKNNDLGFLDHITKTVDSNDPQGRGLTGTAWRTGQPQWTQDYLNDPRVAPWHEYARQAGWLSSASLPLFQNGKAVGCLVIYTDTVNAFDEDARKLLVEMAMDISFALDNFSREADRRRSVMALQASETRYRLAFQTSQDAVCISRVRDGVYVDVNRGLLRMLGFNRDEVIGHSAHELNLWESAEARQNFYEGLLLHTSGCRTKEFRFRKKNGGLIWGLMSASVIDLDGEPCVLSFTQDISDIKAAEEEIKALAFHDSLTQLPNRLFLTERLHEIGADVGQNTQKYALLFVDLDDFKTLNDSRGHTIGDLLLQEVAQRLVACVRHSDTVARLGGDEFVVLIEELGHDIDYATLQATGIGEKILAEIARPCVLAGEKYRCTISIGIVLFAAQHKNLNDLLTQADIAMYHAKAAGRNTLRFFSNDLQEEIDRRLEMKNDIHLSIEKEYFKLYYQPQVDHGSLVGAEALIRWNHPARGLVSPGVFIPLAEETGLILPLGRWVLETACRQIATWGAGKATAHLTLAVNVSALQLRQPDFVNLVLATLGRTGANPRNLKLELTESMLVDDAEDAIAKMAALRSQGVSFSLDDFGTGYSSLSYLKRLPLDQLKIDRSFVRDVPTDADDVAITRTIVALGQAMGLPVIAEGVETEAQRDFLSGLGCQAFQGFLFGRPVPLEEFEATWNLRQRT